MLEKTDPDVKSEHLKHQDEVVELSLSTPPTRLETQNPDMKTEHIKLGTGGQENMQCKTSRGAQR